MAIIETKDLDLYYGTNQALKKINLDINKNEVTALIGPSGCGKSTFLRTLNRMNDLIDIVRVEGKVLFEGKNMEKGARNNMAAGRGRNRSSSSSSSSDSSGSTSGSSDSGSGSSSSSSQSSPERKTRKVDAKKRTPPPTTSTGR